jgi:hypothetical protein
MSGFQDLIIGKTSTQGPPIRNVDDNDTDNDDDFSNTNTTSISTIPMVNARIKKQRTGEELKEKIRNICPEIGNATNEIKSPYNMKVEDNKESLLRFAIANNLLEILDAAHDLACDEDQNNPLVTYCQNHITDNNGAFIFINSKKIILDTPDDENYFDENMKQIKRSQNAIKNHMKEIIQNLDSSLLVELNRQKYFESTLMNDDKNITALQKTLGQMGLENTIIETHRGGKPVNSLQSVEPNKICKMFKSRLSTTFDLNASADIPIIEIGDIIDEFSLIQQLKEKFKEKSNNLDTQRLPVYRFYSNYFPNAFSVFIKKKELVSSDFGNPKEIDNLKKILVKILSRDDASNYALSIVETLNNKSVDYFFEDSNDDTIYLLHMFMEKKNGVLIPTFSLQKGPVTADQVTTEVFGVKKRNCLSIRGIKPIKNSLLILSDMSELTKNCHVTYAKTCGDGVAIELVKLYSYISNKTINLLSSDVCCNYRNLFVNGFSTRQLPTKLAGSGLGFTETKRQIEIYKNTEIISTNILDNLNKLITKYEFVKNYDFYTKLNEKRDDISIKIFTEPSNKYNNSEYFKTILDEVITKFTEKIHNTGISQREYYKDLYDGFLANESQSIQLNEVDKKEICKKLKEFLTCPYFLTEPEDQIENLVNNFMNKFMNLTQMINTNMEVNISESRNVDNIENSFKLISSIEVLLEEIYDDKTTIKQHVLFNLIFAIRKIGTRQINRYVSLIFQKLIDFGVIKEKIKTNIDTLPDKDKYNLIKDIFNSEFSNVKRSNPNYFQKQQIKQPFNLLKYILRALKAETISGADVSLVTYNLDAFQFIKRHYNVIVQDLQSPCGTPAPSAPNTAPNTAANTYESQEEIYGTTTPPLPIQSNNCPEPEEDISTILSPIDDDVENRFDMDEKEIFDFIQENGLKTEPNEYTISNDYNQNKLIAGLLNESDDEVIIKKINEFENVEKSIKGDALSLFSQQERNTLLQRFNSIKQSITNFFTSFFPEIQTNNNDVVTPILGNESNEFIGNTGGKNKKRRHSKKNKKQKKNTIRKK